MIGMISDIQKFSLHDGPGIRTTIFLKGCNMRCVWCHNPETFLKVQDLLFYETKCIGCGSCYKVCKTGALSEDDRHRRVYKKELCSKCGACALECAPQALMLVGKKMTVEQVMKEILSDREYYKNSQGGITVSGGEPLIQWEFVAELMKQCKASNIDTAIESNMSVSWEHLEAVLPYLDRIFGDIKLIDEAKHRQFTGLSNEKTLHNIARLDKKGIPVTVRTPIVPGITDGIDNIRGIAKWLHENAPNAIYELLNYNPLAEAKSQQLAQIFPLGKLKRKTALEMEQLRQEAEVMGVKTIVGGA